MSKRNCMACGAISAMERFEDKNIVLNAGEISMSVGNLSGYECSQCREIEFTNESAKRYADAGDKILLMISFSPRNGGDNCT